MRAARDPVASVAAQRMPQRWGPRPRVLMITILVTSEGTPPSPHEGNIFMTNANPPDKDNPGAQWWETPSAGSGPSPANADQTLLNQNSAPQFSGDPTLLRSDIGQQGAAPQYPSTPSTPQYPSQPQQPQQWQASQPPQQNFPPPQHPQPAYGQQFPPGGPQRGSSTPLLIGGAALLIVVLAVGIGIFAITRTADSAGAEEKSWEGNYTMDGVDNACDLVDPTVIRQWAAVHKETTHTENAPTGDWGGGSLRCRVSNEGSDSDDADLNMDADFDSKYGTPMYETWKKSDTSTTGTGYSSGPVSGIGEEAYYAAQERPYSSFTSFDYTIGVRDSNVSVKVEINITASKRIDKQTVDQVAMQQVRKVLSGLRK